MCCVLTRVVFAQRLHRRHPRLLVLLQAAIIVIHTRTRTSFAWTAFVAAASSIAEIAWCCADAAMAAVRCLILIPEESAVCRVRRALFESVNELFCTIF